MSGVSVTGLVACSKWLAEARNLCSWFVWRSWAESFRWILRIKYWYTIDGLEAYFLTWSDDPLVVTGNWKYPSAWGAAGPLGCLTSCGVPFCGLTGGPFDLVSCVGNSWGLKKLEMLGVERQSALLSGW